MGGVFEQGLGMDPCLLTIPPGLSGQALPYQGHVSSEVLVTTRMAAQRVGPRELVPQTAQMPEVPGLCFYHPSCLRSCVWHLLETLRVLSPGRLPERDTAAA